MSNKLYLWSREANENSDNPIPDGAPEGGTPIDSLNNIMREMMATVRSFFEQPQWRNYGLTIVPVNDTTWKATSGNFTGLYFVGQRCRITDTTFKYGTITSVTEGAELTVVMDMDDSSVLVAPTVVEAGFDLARQFKGTASGANEVAALGAYGNVGGTGIPPTNVVQDRADLTANVIVFGGNGKVVKDTDGFGNSVAIASLVNDSAAQVPTGAAVKSYVDQQAGDATIGGPNPTWTSAAMAVGTTYTNGNSYPIEVALSMSCTNNTEITVECGATTPNVTVGVFLANSGTIRSQCAFTVPPGWSYRTRFTAGSNGSILNRARLQS